jgi:hypothetical protein
MKMTEALLWTSGWQRTFTNGRPRWVSSSISTSTYTSTSLSSLFFSSTSFKQRLGCSFGALPLGGALPAGGPARVLESPFEAALRVFVVSGVKQEKAEVAERIVGLGGALETAAIACTHLVAAGVQMNSMFEF